MAKNNQKYGTYLHFRILEFPLSSVLIPMILEKHVLDTFFVFLLHRQNHMLMWSGQIGQLTQPASGDFPAQGRLPKTGCRIFFCTLWTCLYSVTGYGHLLYPFIDD